jgi:hypothetical protein
VDSISHEDLRVFQSLCAVGGRKTGSVGNEHARRIIREGLMPFDGCAVTVERFPLRVYDDCAASVSTCGETCAAELFDYTGAGRSPAAGRLTYLRTGSSAEFRMRDVTGRTVLVDGSLRTHRGRQIARAERAGAAGIIVVSPSDVARQSGAGSFPSAPRRIPAVSVTGADGRRLRRRAGREARIEFTFTERDTFGANIVADLAGPASGRMVVVGAHYDGWGPAAQDNALSVPVMLHLVRRARSRHAACGYRFVFFDAEELGMLGSLFHVTHNELGRYACYLNLDMVVPSGGGRLKAIAFSRSMRRYFSRADALLHGYVPVPLWGIYDLFRSFYPSDVHYFHTHGVPSLSTFCTGRHQHTALDTPENADLPALAPLLDVLESTLARAARISAPA